MEKIPPPSYDEASQHQPGFMPQPNMQPGYPPQPNMQPGYPPQPNMQSGFVLPPNQPKPSQPQSYPQQLPQSFPQQLHQPQVVMVATPPMTFGPNSQPMTCPHCHHPITTRVETESSSRTHLFAVVLCIVGCIPCCLLPYCMDSCQNRNHYCPSCSAFLGSYANQ